MNSINLIIDNKEVKVSKNTTILSAAISAGIYIPSLCSHPDLPPASLEISNEKIYQGSRKILNIQPGQMATKCGLCIVKINKTKDFINACTTIVKEGMIVTTNSEDIIKERKQKLVPILSRHKHSCLICAQQEGCSQTQCSSNVKENERCCSQFGNCELRKIINYVGIPNNKPKLMPSNIEIITTNPLFNIDYNLCIGCTRCIRVCKRIWEKPAIGFVWDEKNLIQVGKIEKTTNESNCKFCTACVEVCPTGSLLDKITNIEKKEDRIVPCQSSCPANINIPEYLRMISINKFDEADAIIRKKIPFPRTLSRICMHPCEKNCRRKEINNSIAICSLKRFTSDLVYNKQKGKYNKFKIKETNKKIAIVGAGPTGLTSAYYLRKKGHSVTLYDENSKPGGMLRYGIPKYRLPNKILDSEIETIMSIGIDFKPNNKIGADFSLDSLKKSKFDAIVIAVGAQKDRTLIIDGYDLKGVIGGISFLKEISENKIKKIKGKVVVIGGGNVAIDVAMSAVRCGAEEVSMVCLENECEMPASSWETKTARSEGIKIFPSWSPKKINGKNGKVFGITLLKCISVFDEHNNFNPQLDCKTELELPAKYIIVAIGQESDLTFLKSSDIKTENGLIYIKNNFETTINNIYAGGDITTTPGSVIQAISSGRKIAESIDKSIGGISRIKKSSTNKVKLFASAKQVERSKDFIKQDREIMKEKSINQRCNNFDEIELGFNREQSIREARRCLQCDIRLSLDTKILPPEKIFRLTTSVLEDVIPSEIEGVYKLFDENKKIIAIVGSKTIRKDLMETIENSSAKFFEFEMDKMYSKRESELLQKHLQEYGEMPKGDDDIDDLF